MKSLFSILDTISSSIDRIRFHMTTRRLKDARKDSEPFGFTNIPRLFAPKAGSAISERKRYHYLEVEQRIEFSKAAERRTWQKENLSALPSRRYRRMGKTELDLCAGTGRTRSGGNTLKLPEKGRAESLIHNRRRSLKHRVYIL